MSGVVALRAEAIPDALRERDNWVCFRLEPYTTNDGEEKTDKIPVNPHTGGNAASNFPSTWSDLETAIEAHRANDDTDGIGFMFRDGDTLAAVDFDDVRHTDEETGDVTVSEWAGEAIARLDSYTEVSPSGTGFHTWVFGIKPGDSNKTEVVEGEDIEMYDGSDNRFLTVTGDREGDTPNGVNQRADVFADLYREHFDTESTGSNDPDPGVSDDIDTNTDLDKFDVIEKARNAKNGDKFDRLWSGDISASDGDDSHSGADMALCSILNFWTGNNYGMTDDLFRDSGLMRDKWDEEHNSGGDTYGEMTIEAARVSQTYDPEYGRTDPFEHIDIDAILSGKGSQSRDDGWRGVRDVFSDSGAANGPAYFNGRKLLLDAHPVLTEREAGRTLVYNDNRGVFEPDAERKLKRHLVENLGVEHLTNRTKEILAQVEGITETPMSEIGGPESMLCVNNGVLDISDPSDPELDEHNPKYEFMRDMGVAFNSDADCPRFREFVNEVVDPRDVDTLQELAGYTLWHWGQPKKRAGILLGPTDAGKSTFLDIVTKVLGGKDNVSGEKLDNIVNSRWGAAQTYRKYANISNEIGSGELEDLDAFNSIVGNDSLLSAEFKNQNKFTFAPKAKMLFGANDLPEISEDVGHSTREAFFNRLLFVRFPNKVPKSEQTDDLDRELVESEGPGILNWMLEGLARLQEQGGFSHDPPVETKRKVWESNGAARIDSVKQFKRDDFRTNGSRERVIPTERAYRYYEQVCERDGYAPESMQKFVNEMIKDTQVNKEKKHDPLTGKRRQSFVGTEPAERSIWIEYADTEAFRKPFAERIKDNLSPEEFNERIDDSDDEHHIILVENTDTGETTVIVSGTEPEPEPETETEEITIKGKDVLPDDE